ncbi:MAG: DUF177 domain-containing protein [Chitinophagaceae bacterium]|nr:DUF177 domain-containing protein [Chitinophagaceae bacterium]
MKHTRTYDIAFVGLKPGIHEYNYQIDDSFFENFEKPEFNQTQIEVKLSFDKKQGIFLLKFAINGKIIIACDRCGDDYEMNLWDEFELVVKQIDDELVAQKADEDAEVAYIGRSESLLDVSPWIYEFIILSVPIQHIHPDDKEGKSTCNPQALAYLTTQSSNPISANWEELKNKLN